MMSLDEAATKVLGFIDGEEIAKLTLDLAGIPSPRGHEEKVADFIYEWMVKNGFPAFKQEVAAGRNNVVGRLRGSGGGLSLIFNGHMDTAFGLPEDIWILGEQKPAFTSAWQEGDRLIGREIVNDKGPMAAFLCAAKAVKESGVKLKGDIILTCVVGEIGQAPVDEFQGSRYEGKGFGAWHLVSHGVVGDYALVAEATNYAVTWAQAGDVWFKISVLGKGGVYTPHIQRPFSFEDNPNAIVKAAPVITALEEWAYGYEERNRVEFEAGTIVPKVNIGAVRGGLPVRPTQTPGICCIYVDVRLPPGADSLKVKEELGEVVKRCGVKFRIESYLYRRGHIGRNADRLVDALKKAHRTVFNEEPKKIAPPLTSMWRDVNVFNEVGIPCATYGPPAYNYRVLSGEDVPSLGKEDLATTAKIYALTALDLCNQTAG